MLLLTSPNKTIAKIGFRDVYKNIYIHKDPSKQRGSGAEPTDHTAF